MHCRKMEKIHSEWKRKDKLLSFIEEKANILIYIILTLVFFWFFNFIFLSSNIDVIRKKIIESYGLIFSALITVFGVFAGFVFNKRQTYKEIVTRERIEWLHKMQEALAEFLSITSNPKVTNRFKDKKDRARELYYLIISNLNVKEDKEEARKLCNLITSKFNVKKDKEKKNKNERDAVELLYKYANSKGLDVQLNFVKDEDSEEKKDSNDTKSIDELRKEIIIKYTEIFNGTWNRIKNEAD